MVGSFSKWKSLWPINSSSFKFLIWFWFNVHGSKWQFWEFKYISMWRHLHRDRSLYVRYKFIVFVFNSVLCDCVLSYPTAGILYWWSIRVCFFKISCNYKWESVFPRFEIFFQKFGFGDCHDTHFLYVSAILLQYYYCSLSFKSSGICYKTAHGTKAKTSQLRWYNSEGHSLQPLP